MEEITKIAQKDCLPGDIILMAKSANLLIARVDHVTKSGSLRYSFCSEQTDIDHYYDFRIDNFKFDKTAYIQKPYREEYDRYFLLIKREERRR